MTEHAVLTAVGGDRPGLVDAVSSYIFECGCNIEDSRMAVLGGEFAMIILVSGPSEAVRTLVEGAGAEGEKVGLTVHGRRTRAPGEGVGPAAPWVVSAYAMDHPGIVRRVTHLLAERGVNIRNLDTRISHAPHTGQPLFSLEAVIEVPREVSVAELRRALAAIGEAQNVDVLLRPAGG